MMNMRSKRVVRLAGLAEVVEPEFLLHHLGSVERAPRARESAEKGLGQGSPPRRPLSRLVIDEYLSTIITIHHPSQLVIMT